MVIISLGVVRSGPMVIISLRVVVCGLPHGHYLVRSGPCGPPRGHYLVRSGRLLGVASWSLSR